MAPSMGRIGETVQAKSQWASAAFKVCEVDSVSGDGMGRDVAEHLRTVLWLGATRVTL